jgi:nucleotide-binding universal stress UspA family protein
VTAEQVRFSIVVFEGEVKSGLVNQINQIPGEKIVVCGSRGMNALQRCALDPSSRSVLLTKSYRLVLGSVSEHLLHTLQCPVLIVK